MLGFRPYFDIQHNQDDKSCQLYAPAALNPQGHPSVLISFRGRADPRATERGQE